MSIKLKNTEAYMKSFSNRLVELLRIELERNRVRNTNRGSYSGKINSTTRLAQSLKATFDKNQNSSSYDILSEEYGKYVDEGRKTGSPPPIGSIIKWIGDKKIKFRDFETGKFLSTQSKPYKLKQLAFVIKRKIGLEGIKPTNFVDDAIEIAMQKMNKITDSVKGDIVLNIDEIMLRAGYKKSKGDDYIIE